jgi:hypothetical protein
MYITFSRKLKGQRKLMKTVAGSLKGREENMIALRGTKTIKKVITLAEKNGFKKALIVSKKGKLFEAQEIRITRKGKELNWKFGKTSAIKVLQ